MSLFFAFGLLLLTTGGLERGTIGIGQAAVCIFVSVVLILINKKEYK